MKPLPQEAELILNELRRMQYTVVNTVEELGGNDYRSAIAAYIKLRKVELDALSTPSEQPNRKAKDE